MTGDDRSKIAREQTIFFEALDIESIDDRQAYLERACAGDESLAMRVRKLLVAHELTGDFLNEPVVDQLRNNVDHQTSDEESLHPADSARKIDLSFLEPSEMSDSIGRLSHYEVKEVLGSGGFGIVLKAFDEKLHRMVAIKTMLPQLAVTSAARKRFLREARATAAIRHENVVAIYSVDESPVPFLVMELVVGHTLQDRILQTGPLELAEIVSIGRQIARGLESAHQVGLIHRDIKPANVLLEDSTGRVRLTDFGLARTRDDASLTQSHVISGTPLYMSPEQAMGQKVDEQSDLFSLGSVLYVMCTGRPPFRAPTVLAVMKRVCDEEPRPIPEVIPDIPDWLCQLISQLHRKRAEHRIQSAGEVAERLSLGSSFPRSRVNRFGRQRPASPFLIVVGILAGFALLAVALAITDFSNGPDGAGTVESSTIVDKEISNKPASNGLVSAPQADPSTVEAAEEAVTGDAGCLAIFRDHQNPVNRVVFTPDERFVVTSSNGDHHEIFGGMRHHVVGTDNTVRLWNAETSEQLRIFRFVKGRGFGPQSLMLSADGKLLLSASGWIWANGPSEPSVYVWNLADGSLQHHLPPPGNHAIRNACLAEDGECLRSVSSGNGGISQWCGVSLQYRGTTLLDEIPFRIEAPRMSFSTDGRFVLSAAWNADGEILIWDAETGKVAKRLKGHTAAPAHVVMAHDGQRVLSCSKDYTIRLWDVGSEQEIYKLGDIDPLESEPRCVAFSADSTRFVVGYQNGMISLHDTETGIRGRVYRGHTGPIEDVVLSSSGKRAASASIDHTARVWEIPEHWIVD